MFRSADAVLIAKAFLTQETYETRGKTPAQKYALGAMQEVDPNATRISFEEGDRVRNQLVIGLTKANIYAEFEYQGSVPLNVHIRGASDIDLLVLRTEFLTVDVKGIRAIANAYSPYIHALPIISHMMELRRECGSILKARFPQATVEVGDKAIALSGGSLRRKVDAVPAHWHDTAAYQLSAQMHDREVKVLDASVPTTIANRPFMHIKLINEKEARTFAGTKKAIRLLKNLKKDADQEIGLSSYEIAGLVWHFSDASLAVPRRKELALVAVSLANLTYMVENPSYTLSLDAPDKSRKIIDTIEKFEALKTLRQELAELAETIANEIDPLLFRTQGVGRILESATVY